MLLRKLQNPHIPQTKPCYRSTSQCYSFLCTHNKQRGHCRQPLNNRSDLPPRLHHNALTIIALESPFMPSAATDGFGSSKAAGALGFVKVLRNYQQDSSSEPLSVVKKALLNVHKECNLGPWLGAEFVGSFVSAGGVQLVVQLMQGTGEVASESFFVVKSLLSLRELDAALVRFGLVPAMLALLQPDGRRPAWLAAEACSTLADLLEGDPMDARVLEAGGRNGSASEAAAEQLVAGGLPTLVALLQDADATVAAAAARVLGLAARDSDMRRNSLLEAGVLQHLCSRFNAVTPWYNADSQQFAFAGALLDVSATQQPGLQAQLVQQGIVSPLLQMQAIGSTKALRVRSLRVLQMLSGGAQAEAVRATLAETHVPQPAGTTAKEWLRWHQQLQANLSIV